MKGSSGKIQTTHVGSLPRTKVVTDLMFASEAGVPVSAEGADAVFASAVNAVVERQKRVGIDIPSDGETSKISYATYIKDRLTGFEGDSPRRAPSDLEQFPTFMDKLARAGGTATYKRPRCTSEIKVKDKRPLEDDIRRMKTAMKGSGYVGGFMNAATPGVIALFQPNDFYKTQDDYLEAIALAMQSEFEAIVASGLILQLDSPDIGLGRHMMYKDLDEADFLRHAERHIEVLNHALRNIPPDRVRIHVCWGNYEGPHHCDVALERILPIILRAAPRALLFEAANPRHAHEWTVWQENKIPDDYVLIPGVIDSTTNFVEHPQLVAERIERFANIVGAARIIAGTDCGFATFAGFGAVDGEIAWAKLASLVEGAAIASARLYK